MENIIINGLLNKDEEILEQFIDEYGRLIYNSVKSILCSPNERGYVEECVDDVIMLVWQNIDLYNHQGKFKAWLISVARFKALDYKRKYKKYSSNDALNENIEFQKNNLDNDLIVKEELAKLDNLLKNLNTIDRTIIKLKYFGGYTTEEVGKIMNFSPALIYNRLSRAKKKLKKLYLEKEMR